SFRQAHPRRAWRLTFGYAPFDLVRDDIDLLVFIGHLPDRRVVASRIAQQQRVLCAAPSLLARRGPVRKPQDLSRLPCLIHTQLTNDGIWYHLEVDKLNKIAVAVPMDTNCTVALL